MAGIYISWPFCAQKCTYCNFASGVLPKELEAGYLEALLGEIGKHKWRWTPETLYIGGGTPSSISPAHLIRLTGALPGKPWCEATLEAAPGTITAERLTGWIDAGINRISLGVQSFIRQELARTGRKHSAEIVEQDVAMLRAHGIPNINIDLIAGLPGQTETSWRESVAATVRLDVPHVSVYMLEVDEESRLGAEILLGGKRYGASDVPADDRIADFYEIAVEELEQAGILRYEISNFAKPGAESVHNLKYWRRESYIGFGADAHSFDSEARWQNVESVREYVAGHKAAAPEHVQDPRAERFFVGLRLAEGVEASASDWTRFGPAFDRFLSGGVMEQSGNRLRLTPRGLMVSNEIFEEFLNA